MNIEKSLIIFTWLFTFACNGVYSQNIFELLISTTYHEKIVDAQEDDYGNFFLIGYKVERYSSEYCGYILKISPEGEILNEEIYCIEDSTIFYDDVLVSGDSIIVFGSKGTATDGYDDELTIRNYDSDLEFLNSLSFKLLPGYSIAVVDYLINFSGNIILLGLSRTLEEIPDLDIFFFEMTRGLDSVRCVIDVRENNQVGMDFLENFDKNGYNVFGHGTYPNTVTSYDELIRFDSAFAFQSVDTVAWKLRGQHSALWLDDSTYLVTGQKNLYFPTRKDIGIAKLTQNDELIVANHFGKGIDTVNYPGVSSNVDFVTKDNIYFGGTSNFIVGQWPWQTDDSWILLVNLDSNLNVNWQRYYGGDAFYHLFGLLATQDGGCLTYSVRYDENTQFEEYDVYILKVDSNGLFTSIYDIPSLAYDEILFIPNPAVDHVSAQFPGAVHQKEKTLEIYNNLGILVRQFDVSENQDRMQIDVSFLPNGLYYGVMCAKGRRVAAGKLLIAR